MSRYSEDFKRDAVALYENSEELSLDTASAELGVNRVSLHSWVKKYGTGKWTRRGSGPLTEKFRSQGPEIPVY